MTTSPARLLALLLCLALSTPLAVAEDTPSAPAKAPADAAPKADPKIPVTKLLSNGAEPRVELRYKPTASTTAEFKMETLVNVDSPMFKAKIGPIKSTTQIKYAKTANGTVPVDVEIIASEMVDDGSNPMLAGMKTRVEGLKGSKLKGATSDCGVFKAAQGTEKPTLTASTMATQMAGIIVPLPKEAVGVGASWSVTAEISVNNVKQMSVVTSTIEKIDGDRVELSIKTTRTARDVTMNMGGQQVPIQSVDGEGSGKVTIDLSMGGVTASQNKITTKMIMDMMGNVMTTTSTETTAIKGAPAAATTESAQPDAAK